MNGASGAILRNNVYWSMLERFGTVGIQFVLQLVLARILAPDDYGLCAILLVFVNIFTLIVDSGLPMALVQQKQYSQKDYSSVFYAVLCLSVVAYGIIYLMAPACARFFDNETIISTLRVMSLSVIFCAVNSVQVAYVKSQMLFKEQFIASSVAVLVSAVVSIFMAVHGYGVWAIVYQYLISRVVVTIILAFTLSWHPTLEFSFGRIKVLFAYGWKLMASNFLSLIVSDLYTAVIGKVYTKAELGVYDTGSRIPTTISNSLTVSIGAVLFPLFSKHQDEPGTLRRYLHRANIISTLLIFPLMICIAASAEPIVMLVLTDKWAAAVPFMQIACLMYAFYPVHVNNLHVINAVGRSDIGLKLEIKKKLLDLIFLLLFISIGLWWVAVGRLLTSIIGLWINLKPTGRLIGYNVLQQLKDIMPIMCISVVTGVVLLLINEFATCSHIYVLLLQIIAGVTVYFGMSYIFNRSALVMLLEMLKEKK